MYNSLVVKSLAKLWSFFTLNYESSYLKKCVDSINKFASYLFKGSVIKDILVSEDSIIDKTIFYKAYSKIVDFFSNILKVINTFINRIKENSVFCSILKSIYVNIKTFSQRTNLLKTLNNSWIFIFIRDLFYADEAGDQWW